MSTRLVRTIYLVSSVALTACASLARPTQVPTSDARLMRAAWSYEVVLAHDAAQLEVTAAFAEGADELAVNEAASQFIEAVEARSAAPGSPWRAVSRSEKGGWTVASSCKETCLVRYRFRMAEAARVRDDVDVGLAWQGAYAASPSAWLLRPHQAAAGARYQFHVTTVHGGQFATGVRVVPGLVDTWGAEADSLDSAPYTFFGALELHTLSRPGGASIEVVQLPGRPRIDRANVDHWVDLAARAIEAYYGRFPVDHLLLAIAPSVGGRKVGGSTLAGGGASIFVSVSDAFAPRDIDDDWVLTHEFSHLASPSLAHTHVWLEEGLASYVEPLARAAIGTLDERRVWQDFFDGMPQGLPTDDDQGLDRTHTWGRTYWGGALFCLLADVEIRRRTNQGASLQTALRAILAFGNGETHADVDDLLRTGDEATGVPVLRELYERIGKQKGDVELSALWLELGIHEEAGHVAFDERARLASVRRAIVAVRRRKGQSE